MQVCVGDRLAGNAVLEEGTRAMQLGEESRGARLKLEQVGLLLGVQRAEAGQMGARDQQQVSVAQRMTVGCQVEAARLGDDLGLQLLRIAEGTVTTCLWLREGDTRSFGLWFEVPSVSIHGATRQAYTGRTPVLPRR
jgi:hypothetical protein